MPRKKPANSDTLVSFLRRLVPALLLAMVLWLLLRPGLDVGISKSAQHLVRAFEYPKVTQLVVNEHRAEVRRADFKSGSAIPTIPLTEVHFNLIVMLTLFFALRRPLSRKQLERLFMATVTLWLTQTLNLVFHVKTLYALGLGEWSTQHYSDFSRNLWGFLRYFTDLPGRFSFPFLLWLVYNWDRVSALLMGTLPPAPQRRTDSR